VFGVGDDPVKLGLVASLARPGGNATGINFFPLEVTGKRLALLHELVPKAVRVAVLLNPANPAWGVTLREVQEAARVIGLQIQVLNATTIGEIDAVLPPSRASAPMRSSSRPTHSGVAAACNLPTWRRERGFRWLITSVILSRPAG
jgi:hypothetical protein